MEEGSLNYSERNRGSQKIVCTSHIESINGVIAKRLINYQRFSHKSVGF